MVLAGCGVERTGLLRLRERSWVLRVLVGLYEGSWKFEIIEESVFVE